MVVVNSSALVSLLLEDEFDDVANAMRSVIIEEDIVVPSLLRWELLNALRTAERRGHLSPEEVEKKLDQVAALAPLVDARDCSTDLRAELFLARRFNISSYDAAYLELAARKGAKLITRDERLTEAAAQLGLLWSS